MQLFNFSVTLNEYLPPFLGRAPSSQIGGQHQYRDTSSLYSLHRLYPRPARPAWHHWRHAAIVEQSLFASGWWERRWPPPASSRSACYEGAPPGPWPRRDWCRWGRCPGRKGSLWSREDVWGSCLGEKLYIQLNYYGSKQILTWNISQLFGSEILHGLLRTFLNF